MRAVRVNKLEIMELLGLLVVRSVKAYNETQSKFYGRLRMSNLKATTRATTKLIIY